MTQDNQDRDLVLRRKKEILLKHNNLVICEYKCSSLALDREERKDEKEEIGSLETRSNNKTWCLGSGNGGGSVVIGGGYNGGNMVV
uniref:Uncharacterized protein n=1 Tax=Tanacetum cinerariifolium TaxID=118510 RepID=A0A6L2K4C6_TANCI|nr:hypothetical protein [Tanacetum cinerariifolium]